MALPISGQIDFTSIRNEFYGKIVGPRQDDYGTNDADLYNLNFYRGKQYFNTITSQWAQFPAGTIAFSDF